MQYSTPTDGFRLAFEQLVPEMLAQHLLVDLELLGAVSLSEAESRSVLDERALVCGRHIFGWYFPFRVAQLRDARAGGGKMRPITARVQRAPGISSRISA